jgi:hypothetical protein
VSASPNAPGPALRAPRLGDRICRNNGSGFPPGLLEVVVREARFSLSSGAKVPIAVNGDWDWDGKRRDACKRDAIP